MDFLYSLFKEFIKTLILLNTYTNTPQIGVIRISQSMAIWKLICIPWRSSESVDYHRSVCNRQQPHAVISNLFFEYIFEERYLSRVSGWTHFYFNNHPMKHYILLLY